MVRATILPVCQFVSNFGCLYSVTIENMRNGAIVLVVHNLDHSGANQVLQNIIDGQISQSNVIVISPKDGPFKFRFYNSGASVRIGADVRKLIDNVSDILCVICNTIMTADIVVHLCEIKRRPVMWILHEFWTKDEIVHQLKLRPHITQITWDVITEALGAADKIVFVCEAQRKLYAPKAPSTVIFNGVPEYEIMSANRKQNIHNFTILCLGMVCPRKNQLWLVQMFKLLKVMQSRNQLTQKKTLKLVIVGLRRDRKYEQEYAELVEAEAGDDVDIVVHPVSDNVGIFLDNADCLICPSTNEVTPLVIVEAMATKIPVLASSVGGIREMMDDGVEGFFIDPTEVPQLSEDPDENIPKVLKLLKRLIDDEELCTQLGQAGYDRYTNQFRISSMVGNYQKLIMELAPPVLLIDMDNVLVDFDAGFMFLWNHYWYYLQKLTLPLGSHRLIEPSVNPPVYSDSGKSDSGKSTPEEESKDYKKAQEKMEHAEFCEPKVNTHFLSNPPIDTLPYIHMRMFKGPERMTIPMLTRKFFDIVQCVPDEYRDIARGSLLKKLKK